MITTVTLNASIDKAYHMDGTIENGTVMRVKEVRNSAGGKGLNVARVIKLCGAKVSATGLVGGYNGSYLEELLTQDGIPHRFYHIKGETRSCLNILDETFGSTEYLEPGCHVSEEEEKGFLEQFPELTAGSSVVTISGSVPRGMSKDIYGKMIQQGKEAGKRVILDTSGEALEQGIKACPFLVKPNKDEIELLFRQKIQSREELIAGAEKLFRQGIPYVVVSLGGDGALMLCEQGIFQGKPPKIKAVNTVGCGDSMVGAFAVALEKEHEPKEALKFAVAVASANALSPNTGDFDPAVSRQLLEQTEVIRLDL